MRRFFTPALLFRQPIRTLFQAPRPKENRGFNPENQNHLAKAIAEASIKQSNPTKSKYDKDSFLEKYSQAEPLLNICTRYGINDDSIMSAIEEYPEIMRFDLSDVSSVISQLQTLGFHENAISTIISQYPHILQYKPEDIAATIDAYRKNHLGERFIIKLFISYPLLFSLSNEEIKIRLPRINYLMEHKINRMTNVLLRNPSLMSCDWKQVEKNYMYLHRTMRVLAKDISRSQALTKPLSHIKLRHTFLDRCGRFIRHGLKDDQRGFNTHKNPSLHDIVDTNDDEFARLVAKVGPAEYYVFKELMHYEDELEDEDNDLNSSSDFDTP